jgi:hypothetical protein
MGLLAGKKIIEGCTTNHAKGRLSCRRPTVVHGDDADNVIAPNSPRRPWHCLGIRSFSFEDDRRNLKKGT